MTPELPAEYTNWSMIADQIMAIEGLSVFEKEQSKRAMLHLAAVLGESFLEDAASRKHPIMQQVLNQAAWTRRWFSWLADAMKSLANSGNFASLVGRLRSEATYAEALSLLRFGTAFAAGGFDVVFEPRVIATRKVPDLEVIHRNTGERLYVELSELRESRVSRAATKTSWGISVPLFTAIPFLHYAGRIHKSLSEHHLNEVVKRVADVLQASRGGFQELTVAGVLDLGVAPEKDLSILEKWAEDKGMHVGRLEGPPFGVDEMERVRGAINREQRQLPSDSANLLIIAAPTLFLAAGVSDRVVSTLEEAVYEHKHLLGVAITCTYMGGREPDARMFGAHGYTRTRRFDILAEEQLFLLNKYCSFKVSAAVLSDLYRSLLH